jgi:DNA-binding GntR family transcriptional regulator
MPLISLHLEPDLTERVYSALQEAIINGDLAPGVRMTQEELAEKLAVSRQPVLQALRQLKRDGFVVDAPLKSGSRTGAARGARGVMVSALDAALIRQVYQVRSALVALAARQAAAAKAMLP